MGSERGETSWERLDLEIPEGQPGYITAENVELLRALAQETVKSQVEGGRLLITRCYVVLSQASTLTAAAVGGAGFSSGAVGPLQGWTGHWSVFIGFVIAALIWGTSALLALRTLLPNTLSGATVEIQDVYSVDRLSGDSRQLKLEFIQLFGAALKENKPKIEGMRRDMRRTLQLIALAPITGMAVAVMLHLARRLFFPIFF